MTAAAASWLVDAMRKMFYLVTPTELALDDSDPEPKWLLKQGIPAFFLMIAAEAIFTRVVMGKGVYRLHELLTCISLGSFQLIGQAAFALLFQLVGLSASTSAYRWVWEHCRLFTIDSKSNVMLCYVCLLLGKDFGYYWAHRAMHEFHVLWVGHSVHHSGEDYHLGTALRQGIGQAFVWPFYAPLAVLGFHPHAFAAHSQLNTLYMFWIHSMERAGPRTRSP
jgi:alkylglycerol monooxygenase